MKDDEKMDQLAINTIRTLSMDAVQQANSRHPGTPMSMGPVVYCLWQHFLRFDPDDPIWPNRGRFVLSVGHASMLLYSMLHLTGVKAVDPDSEIVGNPSVSLDDIKNFRQLGSRCAGHPEYRDSVLPPSVPARVAVEQASTLGWERYVGTSGRIIGMNTFGASAPLKELQKKFGFDPEHVAATAKELLGRN
jgi:transketolase